MQQKVLFARAIYDTSKKFCAYVGTFRTSLLKSPADDTCIFQSRKNLHTLENEVNSALKNISDWLISNKLTLNIDKTNFLFSNTNNIQKTDLDIQLGNEKLEVKEYAKYLRIYFDSKLTWEKQIQITNSELHKGIGIIRTMWY